MKIAICGTRGIPNNYGGFEQCAEILAVLLTEFGHEVTVYNPSHHPYTESIFNGVHIKKIYNPEKKIGTAGNFIYDYLCMKDAVNSNADILLLLGYTTSSVFLPFLSRGKSVIATNMDGLEWKRDKWNAVVKQLAKWFESLGAKYSDYLIADNREIKNYLHQKYKKESTFIAYGAEVFDSPDVNIPAEYKVKPREYDMLIARLEKENNIEAALDGVVLSGSKKDFLVIGNYNTPYGKFLVDKYKSNINIRFTGGIYNLNHLNNLRWYCRFYFHGHSVGGTNPSLLEAMASKAYILAHDNAFNKDVLGVNAYYFKDSTESAALLLKADELESNRELFTSNNRNRIRDEYNWTKITKEYEQLFELAVRS